MADAHWAQPQLYCKPNLLKETVQIVMNKSKQLNQWLWKWHIIAGLVSVPIMALLCITGAIYLFKGQFNDYVYDDARFTVSSEGQQHRPFSEQLNVAEGASDSHIMSVTLPQNSEQTTAFREHATRHARNLIYVNPYTSEVTGTYQQKESFMYTVRKLHGELLLGQVGTLVVELVASWFIVLALTGIYVWWPFKKFSASGFFTIRTNKTRKIFWRDMHAVLAFWMSLFMLIILAGGMPWTELFGDNLKWVQQQTNTGYPQHWRNSKGLESNLSEDRSQSSISLDQVVDLSNEKNLKGEITIKIPMEPSGVFTVTNKSFWLEDQRVLHVDQYSGEIIKELEWNQVGILMVLRQVFMRLHQGEYGTANLIAVLMVALTFFLSTTASLISYLVRKPKGRWGLPKVPASFNAGLVVTLLIGFLALLFPAFGLSLLLILVGSWLASLFAGNQQSQPQQ